MKGSPIPPIIKKASFLTDVTRTPNYLICFQFFITSSLPYRELLIFTRPPETLPEEMGVLSSGNVEAALRNAIVTA